MQKNAAASVSSLNLQALRSPSYSHHQQQQHNGHPPILQRTMTAPVLQDSSSSSIGSSAPTAAAGSIFNKPASVSLYQTCRIITDRLRDVPDFEDLYLNESPVLESPISPTSKDPVNDLWRCFRTGSSLCHLYNATKPDIELPVRQDGAIASTNVCKAEVYHFLLACRNHLGFGDDDLFSISELYSENTNGFVKVTKTVSLVLDILQERQLLVKRDDTDKSEANQEAPKDNRAKVIAELLETERKYVQYLEILQNYMRELQIGEVISADTSHMLFANLNALVDFQRRFLIGIETTCASPPDQQHIGLVFSNLEEAFSVYEPFCSNYTYAAELAIEETPKLKRLEHLVEPTYELPSLLIKPIQRICKYPLLLRELIKYTNKDDPYFAELEDGENAIKRVTDRVNETQRRQENEVVVMELERRVEDWKGHSVASFGSLLLEDNFLVMKGDIEREYRVYLFERILLCCKESLQNKKNSKSMSISKKPKKRASLQLKGRIFINNVTEIVPITRGSVYTLQVFWRGDQEQEFFVLRCKNEENLKQWHQALAKLLEEAKVALAEYKSNSNSSSISGATRTHSNTQFTSMQQMNLHYKDRTGYESDEESHRTEDTADDGDSITGSVSMSREHSTQSLRSRSTTNESGSYNRYGTGVPTRKVSNGMPRYLHVGASDANASHFSPALDSESPYGASRTNTGNAYPFPRTSYHDHEHNSNTRNTAPAMTRTASRESANGRPLYGYTASRNSNSSNLARPVMTIRSRSASSPNINGYPQRPNISIPEVPTPLPPSAYQNGYTSSPAESSKESTKGSPSSSTKVKVNYKDDIFVILLSPEVDFQGLTDRVEKKIRLCGHSTSEVSSFRIRYKDEDGDLITINSNDDVQMALESSEERDGGLLTLYASPVNR